MTSAEEVMKAFADFGLSRKKFELFSSKFYTEREKEKMEKGLSYQTFHYIMKFAQQKKRLTPAQKRKLETVAERLEKIEGIDLSIPAKVLREFIQEVKVETKGQRGK